METIKKHARSPVTWLLVLLIGIGISKLSRPEPPARCIHCGQIATMDLVWGPETPTGRLHGRGGDWHDLCCDACASWYSEAAQSRIKLYGARIHRL